MTGLIQLKWKRPTTIEYPKVWLRFEARDLNSDKLVEYRIEDLTDDRAEEGYQHMRDNYLAGEPVTVALGEKLNNCNQLEKKLFIYSINFSQTEKFRRQ